MSDTPPPVDELLGQVLDDRFQIGSRLGAGGMGVIYKAEDLRLGREVAVKLLTAVTDQVAVARWRRETIAGAAFSHPNLVKILASGVWNERVPFIVMEFVEGPTLQHLIKNEGRLSAEKLRRIIADTCSAIAHAHASGIVHRDIKPSNIMIGKDVDGHDLVKVLDFGIARSLESGSADQKLTATGAIIGSAAYMSPEQCAGTVADIRSDLYSLACVIFESLTGRPVFVGDSELDVMYKHLQEQPALDGLSSGARDFFQKALAKDPSQRYQSAAELESAFMALSDSDLAGISVERKSSYALSLTGVLVLLLAVFAALYYMQESARKNTANGLLDDRPIKSWKGVVARGEVFRRSHQTDKLLALYNEWLKRASAAAPGKVSAFDLIRARLAVADMEQVHRRFFSEESRKFLVQTYNAPPADLSLEDRLALYWLYACKCGFDGNHGAQIKAMEECCGYAEAHRAELDSLIKKDRHVGKETFWRWSLCELELSKLYMQTHDYQKVEAHARTHDLVQPFADPDKLYAADTNTPLAYAVEFQGRRQEAAELYDKGIEVCRQLLAIYLKKKTPEQALAEGDNSIKLVQSHLAAAYAARAGFYMRSRQVEKAMADLDQSDKVGALINEQLVQNLCLRGNFAILQGQRAAGEKAYRKAEEKIAAMPNAAQRTTSFLLVTDNAEAARLDVLVIESLTKALIAADQITDKQFSLMVGQRLVGKWQTNVLEQAQNLAPLLSARGQGLLFWCVSARNLRSGNLDEAERACRLSEEAFKRQPSSGLLCTRVHEALISRARGKTAEGIKIIQQALSLDLPPDAEPFTINEDCVAAMLELGSQLRGQGKTQEAEPYLERAVKMVSPQSPQYGVAYFLLGDLRQAQKRPEEARIAFEVCRHASMPGDSRHLQINAAIQQGYCLSDQGKFPQAIAMLESAGNRASQDKVKELGLVFDAYESCALIYVQRLNQPQKAVPYLWLCLKAATTREIPSSMQDRFLEAVRLQRKLCSGDAAALARLAKLELELKPKLSAAS